MGVKIREVINMSNKEFKDFLETIVWRRMTIKQMEDVVNEFLGTTNKVRIVKSSINWNNLDIADYNLIGTTEEAYNENENLPFCDFDIYVLPTKERVGRNIVYYITEVGYVFE